MSLGLTVEDAVTARLSSKCDIKRDPVFDHEYMLDFIVDRFKSIEKLRHIGVQITTNPSDLGKKARFVSARKTKRLIDRSLYVQIHPKTDFNAYGFELLYVALVHFTFCKELADKDIMGLNIGPEAEDYYFFDIEDEVERMRNEPLPFDKQPQEKIEQQEPAPDEATPAPEDTATTVAITPRQPVGRIRKYLPDGGFGFIQSNREGGIKDDWFFHITDCDQPLQDELKSRLDGYFEDIRVTFTDNSSKKKDDKTSPPAIDVHLYINSCDHK